MTMTKNKLYHMVLAGILCAIGIVVPMFMPRIVLGPMSFTLASHVAVFHAAAEMLIVTPFFMSGALFTPEQLANGFVASVVLLVGVGTVIHSMLDYSISILVWKPLCTAMPQLRTSQD